MNAAEVVTLQHLVKRYGPLIAVNDVSFSISEGEIFGVIGRNGAGKTTCVECISGLRTKDVVGCKGEVRVARVFITYQDSGDQTHLYSRQEEPLPCPRCPLA